MFEPQLQQQPPSMEEEVRWDFPVTACSVILSTPEPVEFDLALNARRSDLSKAHTSTEETTAEEDPLQHPGQRIEILELVPPDYVAMFHTLEELELAVQGLHSLQCKKQEAPPSFLDSEQTLTMCREATETLSIVLRLWKQRDKVRDVHALSLYRTCVQLGIAHPNETVSDLFASCVSHFDKMVQAGKLTVGDRTLLRALEGDAVVLSPSEQVMQQQLEHTLAPLLYQGLSAFILDRKSSTKQQNKEEAADKSVV